MKKVLNLAIVITAVVSMYACGSEGSKDAKVISVDCSEYVTLNLDDFPHKELLSESAIGAIEHICFIGGEMFIHSGQQLSAYDTASGKEMASFSRRGRANDEYVSLWGFNVGAGKVFLQDLSGSKMLQYSPSGELERTFETERPTFQAFAILKDGQIVGKRSFEGIPTVELSTWGNEFVYSSDVATDEKIASGIMLNYPFYYTSKGEVLYNRYFRNEVYTVQADGLSLRYRIDFGGRNLSQLADQKDEYDALDLFRKSSGKASYISNLSEDEKYVAFQFIMSPEGVSFAVHDKSSKKTKVIRFNTEHELSSIIAHEGVCYVIAQDADGASLYFQFKIKDLFNQ